MTFQRDFFEYFNDNVDGIFYFSNKSSLKPLRIGTNMPKLPEIPHFLLHYVLCIPKLQRNMLSLMHIQQQGHSIHIFSRKVEIRKAYDNMVVMTGVEDGRLLKLKGTFYHVQNYPYLSHHDEGKITSSLLWHPIFGHINYESLHFLKKYWCLWFSYYS
jgi:hypothetical protein